MLPALRKLEAHAIPAFAHMVEGHELQHQIDADTLRPPDVLWRAMTGYEDSAIMLATNELSGFLAEIVQASRPKLALLRFHAASTLLAQDDEAAVPALAHLLGDEESVRVRTRIAEGLVTRGWATPEGERDAVRRSLPPAFAVDAAGRIVKR